VSALLDQVEESIRARRLFRPGQRILVAVSGGVDSVVLLHLLHRLGRKHRWRLTVGHLNHQLRARSSEADERLVRRTAAKLKLPVVVERADVGGCACTRGWSLEMAARELRHGFLARAATRLRIPSVALAQHADDQIELFFLRLLRGSGGEGLAGMKWRNRSPSNKAIKLARPLLDQPKRLLREWALAEGVKYREDASNAAVDFQRNRIRHELLPLLRRKYQPALDRTIRRAMEIVGAEAEFTMQAARQWLQGTRERKKSRVQFERLPVAVQRRCVQFQLVGQGTLPDFELVEQLRVNSGRPVAVGLVHAVLRYAVRDRDGLVHVRRAMAEEFRAGTRQVHLRGRAGEMQFGGVRISWRICRQRGNKRSGSAAHSEHFDADKVGPAVVLRHWRPGDRFQPIGMGCSVKLQDFFTNQKVPREKRHRLVVAGTAQGEVFWVEGMRISERFKLTADTNRRLQWAWDRF